MNRLRTFLMSMNVLNGLLMAAVASVVYFGVIPVLDPTIAISLPRAKPAAILSGQPASTPLNVSPADYAVISDQNLFHPERRIPPEKQPEKVIPRPDLFLYGTLITDEGSFAFIEDRKTPYSTVGRGKRQTTLKKGDSLQGYVLREVLADRIVLVKGDDRVVVMLNDGAKRRAGESQVGPAALGFATAKPPGAPVPPSAKAPTAAAVPPGFETGGTVGSRTYAAPAAAIPGAGPDASNSRRLTRREQVEAGRAQRLQLMQQGQ
jgi:hypothetical protein